MSKKSYKLKFLLEEVPAGFLVDSKWLVSHGFSYGTFRDYVKRGWLERVHRGVFRRPVPRASRTNILDWRTCILSLQHIMRNDIHVGGSAALSLRGYSHYLRFDGKFPVWVYGDRIPNWLLKVPLDSPIIPHSKSLFADKSPCFAINESLEINNLPWDWKLRISEPERAFLEALDELPDNESFHMVDMMFEGMLALRPKLLTELLHNCKKIKVRRLFFVFANRHNPPWFKWINPDDFDLGSGDRALYEGGKLHPLYRIMVPEDFAKKSYEQEYLEYNGPI